jgi:hypothetical protein
MKFCELCGNLLVKKIVANSLVLECNNCKNISNKLDVKDILLYEEFIFNRDDYNQSMDGATANQVTESDININNNNNLKNIAEDPVTNTVKVPCIHCNKPFVKQFISRDFNTVMCICDCSFK